MPPPKGGLRRLYDKLAEFNIENLFVKKRQPGPPRAIYVNQDLPPHYLDKKGRPVKEHVYPTNQVVTSKYNIITFLPRNLLEQFRRIANIFFAAIAILQFFSLFSTISPGLVILPLIIVLGITAGKDGYEDIKRHQSDRRINFSQVRILDGGAFHNENAMHKKSRTFFRDGLPKGLPKISFKRKPKNADKQRDAGAVEAAVPPEAQNHRRSEKVAPEIEFDHEHELERSRSRRRSSYGPRSSEGHGHSLFSHHKDSSLPHWRRANWEDVRVGDFVKVLNDESFPADILICATSEEENVCFVETKNLDGETNLKSRNAVPELTHLRTADACADPANAFTVELDRPDPHMYKLNGAVVTRQGKHPLDLQTVLLRGTVLKNTRWIIGMVMFTGEDTKIVLNSGGTPSKRSRVERQMNPQVFINLTILAAMAVACGILDSILEHRYYPLQAPWMLFATQSDDNPSINGLITFIFAFLTFQNIVPISLYISIEAVRTCQAAFIFFDKNIWYAKTDQPTLARSWNLSDDLGQIEYIFSDKTGTLTQNWMVFRHCSIGGRVYRGEDPTPTDTEATDETADEKDEKKGRVEPVDVRLSSTSASASSSSRSREKVNPDPIASTSSAEAVPDPLTADLPAPPPVQSDPGDDESMLDTSSTSEHQRAVFKSDDLQRDLTSAVGASAEGSGAGADELSHARMLNGFFNVLALCHTVLASVDRETGRVEYKAQSPDEAALVQAAADAGFVFRGRDKEILRLETPFAEDHEVADGKRSGQLEEYELLNLLDFTSSRKRMSVLVRKRDDDDRRIFLLTKGADNVIFDRLKPGVNDALKEVTGRHLDQFASEGLRTLTLAYKVVPDEFYEEWIERYEEATVALEDREAKIEAVSDEIERDLRLLGATAIEDRLQDGVPETIADLKLAGIKIWVATGDKLETAIAIGYSTNLISQESNLIVIRGGDHGGTRSVYQQMYTAVEEFFPESDLLQDKAVLDAEKLDDEGSLRRVNTGVSSIVGRNNGDRPGGFVLVIEGIALGHALVEERSKALLLKLAMLCEGVICCRTSPLQKALIVKLVKEGIGAMTLAIGDGANDVSMIQAADVGVGISGEEGLQAVNSSDYAIAQFRFLKRLLLVHGHMSYARNGNMIVNFFYKNMICIGVLFWFQIYCGWSSQYVFEYSYLLFWNVFWTLCPVIAIGVFDRIVDDDILETLPELYRYGREHYWYGNWVFSVYMLDAVYQSAIIYFIIQYAYFSPTARPDGFGVAQLEYATTMVIVAVMAANAYNGLNTAAWTGWVFFAVLVGIVLVWAYTAIYSLISPGWFYVPVYGNDHYLFRSALFWLVMPITFCLCLLPRYIAKYINFNFTPTDIDVMRWIRKVEPNRRTREELCGEPRGPFAPRRDHSSRASMASRPSVFDARGSRTDMATGVRSVHRGFDFSTEENGVAMQRMQTNLSERRQSSRDLASRGGMASKTRHLRSGSLNFLSRSLRRKKPTTLGLPP